MKSCLNLETINLKNFATFTNQTINFCHQFNTIVGETGSGKSLILDALQLCFGHRADKSLVRKDAEYASIEVTFSYKSSEVKKYFDKIGYPFDDEITIKRLIYANGKSKSFLNLSSCSLATLNKVSRNYIDLVGQFENQKLLSESHQLKLLDNYSKNDDLFKAYSKKFEELKEQQNQLTILKLKRDESLQKKDFLEFQIKELKSLDPSPEDEEELKERKDSIVNQEQRKKSVERANFLLNDSDHSILNQLVYLEREFRDNEEFMESIMEAKEILEDLSYRISKFDTDEIETSLEEIIERLDLYQKLKRKYRCETYELSEIYQQFQDELDGIENIDSEIDNTLIMIDRLSSECEQLANKLHLIRQKNASKISKEISQIVNKLNMKGAIIEFRVSKAQSLCHTGFSILKIYSQTNPGEGFYPLNLVASGGELSRILLAIRQVLSTTSSISVFLFDEIDTGIGGETAVKIGQALKNVSGKSQVIAITHLAQIARFSDQITYIEKESLKKNNLRRTVSSAKIYKSGEYESLLEKMQGISI